MGERIAKRLGKILKMSDQRRHTRLKKNFQVTLGKKVPGILDVSLEGHTLNLSQDGAFIKTDGWHFFEHNDLTDLIFFLPADFTGRDNPMGLQGSAIVRRVDRLREGIAVEFTKTLRKFILIAMC